jgi:hypothetical protein
LQSPNEIGGTYKVSAETLTPFIFSLPIVALFYSASTSRGVRV